MPRTAVFWIRDGVLIDRMPVNAVAFAIACLSYTAPGASVHTNVTELINFAFETSGISCADKMAKFNKEKLPLVADVAAAAAYYNELAGKAAESCAYFSGACELVGRLKAAGALNFITSAVEQSVLDQWAKSVQGGQLTAHLTEILGKRDRFNKGRDHFAHVFSQYGVERIFYVADAVAEIRSGATFAEQFAISPIGFANVISAAKIKEAYQLVLGEHEKLLLSKGESCVAFGDIDESALCLPGEAALANMLKAAGATFVVGGEANHIVNNLTAALTASGLLPLEEVSSE